MNKNLVKLIYATIFIFPLNSFAKFNVSITNLSDEVLEIYHPNEKVYTTHLFRGSTPILESKFITYLGKNEFFNINDENEFLIDNRHYKISFKYLNLECSWIHSLGVFKKPHGWALSIFINDKNSGTICANKYSIFDPLINSSLEFFRTKDNQKKLQFKNLGWWINGELYPTILEYNLE